MQLSSW